MSYPGFETAHELWTPDESIHVGLLLRGISPVVVNSAPMGGGKSGVNKAIMNFAKPYDENTYGRYRKFSVSKTTRSARPGEINGVDYEFDVNPEYFEPAFENGEMLEIDHHANNYYGTPMPRSDHPLIVEIEVRGFNTAMQNPHPSAEWFRINCTAIYIAQQSVAQLIAQILERPDDTISEQSKLARVSRYPGELRFILDNCLPYHVISNVPGSPEVAQKSALQVIADDIEAPVLCKADIRDLVAEACDGLLDFGLEPTWL